MPRPGRGRRQRAACRARYARAAANGAGDGPAAQASRGLDRRLQRVVAGEVQGVGGDRDRGAPLPGRSGRERAPGPQPASRRSGIGAGASEVERVAQRRLVFAAAGAAHAGGRGGEREALAPGAGPRRVFAHDRIEPGERGAGEKPGFGLGFRRVEGARPGRERRRRGGRKTRGCRTNRGARACRTVPRGGAFGQPVSAETAAPVVGFACPIRLHYRTSRALYGKERRKTTATGRKRAARPLSQCLR